MVEVSYGMENFVEDRVIGDVLHVLVVEDVV